MQRCQRNKSALEESERRTAAVQSCEQCDQALRPIAHTLAHPLHTHATLRRAAAATSGRRTSPAPRGPGRSTGRCPRRSSCR
ncbi:hypothetical protein EJO70_13020 [Variovorax sp. 553]|nr:hypothetical protein EJO70_13020 [Variovorax sp. 553]RSZ43703.1 hypothetical protein EJO71_13010 [Variovorax sp. 679]